MITASMCTVMWVSVHPGSVQLYGCLYTLAVYSNVLFHSLHPGWVQLCFIGCGPFCDVTLAFVDDKFHVCLSALAGDNCTHSCAHQSLMKVDSFPWSRWPRRWVQEYCWQESCSWSPWHCIFARLLFLALSMLYQQAIEMNFPWILTWLYRELLLVYIGGRKQRIAVYCSTVLCIAVHCSILQFDAVQLVCNVVQCHAV